MNIVLLGPPGAGKGTQAKTMAAKLNRPHISTGDILRKNVSENTLLGRRAKDYMNKGALVPDELVTQMLTERISQPDTASGFILDGYPRNLNQARTLDETLAKGRQEIDLVVYLDTSETVIIQRLSGRLVCSKCGANFHVKNMPPKKEMTCDNCGGSLYQRDDDKEETIRKRLVVYRKESAPLIEYYESRHKLFRVNADGDAESVLRIVLDQLRKRNDSLKV